MDKEELKSLLLQLEEQAEASFSADPAERLLSLVAYAFEDEGICASRMCKICGISKSTFYRKQFFRFTPSTSTNLVEAQADGKDSRDIVRDSFVAFCKTYPKTAKGWVLLRAFHFYKCLFKEGYSREELEDSVLISIASDDWQKERGRYIPRMDYFLERLLLQVEEERGLSYGQD